MKEKNIANKELSIWQFIKLPDYFSLASLSASLIAINLSSTRYFAPAALLILFSTLLDGLDGIVARFIKRSGRFGAELDSIADVVAFGVAPAIFLFFLGLDRIIDFSFLILFVLASALRLARFNINKVKGHFFLGLPTTANGIIIPLLYFVFEFFNFDKFTTQVSFLIWVALSTFMMTSTLIFPKPFLGPKKKKPI